LKSIHLVKWVDLFTHNNNSYKYKVNAKDHTHSDGKSYRVVNGVLTVPFEINAPFAILIEEIKEESTDNKDELIKLAVELGVDSESKLKRNSIETIKKKIEEAK